eukprot:TRINITY_DN2377_c0_g2_i11.p2 TRINITY_DN2377_c0_g2~~TRINITY_DN2377_c0_g2_i11.p2  ORF type:complete len:167 (+),score=45.83 TRINITY_DN2377_c0_g2_i11:70-570(+)
MVQWSWEGDSGWVDYSPETNAIIQKAHELQRSRVAVDAERFVDFENMLQRRYDDEMKRRRVKSNSRKKTPAITRTKVFDHHIFALFGTLPKSFHDLAVEIESHGGVAVAEFIDRATFVICPDAEKASFATELKAAAEQNVPVVSYQFLVDAITANALPDPASYLVQ